MNFLRRFAILLYGLALLALVSVVLLFPETVADALRSLAGVNSTIRAAIAIVVGFIILIALFIMIRAPRFNNQDGLIVKTPGALADVGIASARERILKAVEAVPNVVSADMKLSGIQGKADIDLSVEVAGSNINVPNKQREIDRALKQVTLKQLGLQLASRPRVHIQLVSEEELRARDEAARRPLAAPVIPPAPAAEVWTPSPQVVAPPLVVPVAPPVAPVSYEPVIASVAPPEFVQQDKTQEIPVVAPVPPAEIPEPDWEPSVAEDDLPDFLTDDVIVDEAPVVDEPVALPPEEFVIPPAASVPDDVVVDEAEPESDTALNDDWLTPDLPEDDAAETRERRTGDNEV